MTSDRPEPKPVSRSMPARPRGAAVFFVAVVEAALAVFFGAAFLGAAPVAFKGFLAVFDAPAAARLTAGFLAAFGLSAPSGEFTSSSLVLRVGKANPRKLVWFTLEHRWRALRRWSGNRLSGGFGAH